MASLFGAVLPKMSGASEFASFFDDPKRCEVLQGIFEAYYKEQIRHSKLIFDTNRIWTARLPLLHLLFPTSRVICCVRDVSWVIDSVEKMVRRNATHVSKMFNGKSARNVYSRVDHLMNSEEGLIGLAWSSLREAWFGEHAKTLIAVRYESLTREPSETLQRLYAELGEPPYAHDFDAIEYEEDAFDEALGMPGLHTVRRRVEFVERPTILPPDIFCKYIDSNFWLNDKLNTKSVLVL